MRRRAPLFIAPLLVGVAPILVKPASAAVRRAPLTGDAIMELDRYGVADGVRAVEVEARALVADVPRGRNVRVDNDGDTAGESGKLGNNNDDDDEDDGCEVNDAIPLVDDDVAIACVPLLL